MKIRSALALAALTASTFGGAAQAATLVTNGGFLSTSSTTTNTEFGTGFGGQVVAGWTGNGGYNLFFTSAASATTVSAKSQYSGGKEDLWAATTSPGGGSFVALDGDPSVEGGISQTISGLVAGQAYKLSFDWGAGQVQSKTGATTEQLQVSLGTQTFTTPVVSNPSEGFTGWFNQAFTFTAQGTSEVLNFLSIGTPGGLPPIATLDDVSLVQTPEPVSVALLGAGLIGLGAARLRRSRR